MTVASAEPDHAISHMRNRSAARRARDFSGNFRPLKREGAGNAGCPMHPQPCVRYGVVSMHTGIHSGGTGKHPAFPTRWFTVYSALFPGTTALLTPSSARRVGVPANLTPASGRQNHTASPSATRSARLTLRCVHRTPPHVHDDRERPSCRGGIRGAKHIFLKNGSIIFWGTGVDGANGLKRLRKLRRKISAAAVD
jgi:hypothetical protein